MEEGCQLAETIKSVFDQMSPSFDAWIESLEGKVYGYVTWEHLRQYLPADRTSSILDAGGGTGRWTVPLARMGYAVTLCDISPGMLRQARIRIEREGLSDRVTIEEQDLTRLSYENERFDFVLCEDNPISISDSRKVVNELVRVLKVKGRIWAAVLGRYPVALMAMKQDPEKALKLCRSELNLTQYREAGRARLFTPQELRSLFEQSGIGVVRLYGNRIAVHSLLEETQRMTNYDMDLFSNIAAIELYLSEIPAILEMAEYLQIVGEKQAPVDASTFDGSVDVARGKNRHS